MKSKLIVVGVALGLAVIAGGLCGGMSDSVLAAECNGVKTSIIGGDICDNVNPDSPNAQDSAIWKLLILVLNILTAGVGVLAVGGIAYASLMYVTARDSMDRASKARDMIQEIVWGIVFYGFIYTLLNFLIPGGVFQS